MRFRAGLWAVAFLALCAALVGLSATGGLNVESRLTALIPATYQTPWQTAAMQRLDEFGQRRLIVVVAASDAAKRRSAATAAADVLRHSAAFTDIATGIDDLIDSQQRRALKQQLFAHRFHLLAPEDRRTLARLATDSDNKAARAHFLNRARQRLYGLGVGDPQSFAADPLALGRTFSRHALARLSGTVQIAADGRLVATGPKGIQYAVVFAKSRANPFSMSGQSSATRTLERARAAAHDVDPGAHLTVSGVIRHAAAASQRARFEASVIGAGSLAGIFLVMLWAFASVRPFALGVLSIAGGLVLATLATRLIFGRIHVLTLVFGASLVGVAIDYGLHFFAERWHSADPKTALARVRPAITLGLATSVAAYAGMALAPFPALRQIAVFAAFGLLGGWLGVVLLMPGVAGAPPRRGRALQAARFWLHRGPGRLGCRHPRAVLVAMSGAALAMGALTAAELTPNDNIGVLYHSPPALAHADQKVAAILGTPIAARVLVVHADTPATALSREYTLVDKLTAGAHPIADVEALTQTLPPPAIQNRDYRRLKQTLYRADGPVVHLLEKTGFSKSAITKHMHAFKHQRGRPLSLQTFFNDPATAGVQRLWLGAVDGQYASLVRVHKINDPAAFSQRVNQADGVQQVDRAATVSQLLGHYRRLAAILLGLAYCFAFCLLLKPFGLFGTLAIELPPLLASVTVTALFALTGWHFSLFNMMALVLLLGLGADYGIFLRYARRERAPAALAVGLSTITTLLAFGLLGASSTPALHDFGVTLAIGLVLTFALASTISGHAPTPETSSTSV